MMNIKRIFACNFSVFIYYLLLSSFLFKDILFASGIILGGDWGLPFTTVQISNHFEIFSHTWGSANLGNRSIGLNGVLFSTFFYLASLFNLNGAIISKSFLLFLFILAPCSFYSLLRYLNLNKVVSFIGGLIYTSTPIFFDYSIMGWLYVILFMGLLPVGIKYFLKANLERKVSYSLVVAIVYSLSLLQSQALFWYAIIFLILGFYLVHSLRTFWLYVTNLFFILIMTFLLSFFWIGGLLIVKDVSVAGSDIVSSVPSIGTSAQFYPLNIIRLFGSLYNFQYEYIVNNSKIAILSFLSPLFAILSLLFNKVSKKITLTFLLIGMVPVLMYGVSLYRYLLVYIPYSNIFRDFARFTVFSTFSYSVLISIFFDYLYQNRKIVFIVCASLWILSIFPWWSGYISKWQINAGPNQRLRLKKVDKEYNDLDYLLAYKKLDRRALFLPIDGAVSFEDDDKFKGSYQEAQDIFATYSPIEGQIVINDRNLGYGNLLSKNIIKKILDSDFKKIFYLNILSQDYFIIRKNMIFSDKTYISKILNDNEKITKILENNKIAIYKKSYNFLPRIYTPQVIIHTAQNLEILPEMVSDKNYSIRSAIYFKTKKYNPSVKSVYDSSELNKEIVNTTPVLEYKKINSTKYRVIVHGAKDTFPLIFSESFHEGWKTYLASQDRLKFNTSGMKSVIDNQISKYKILDGNTDDQANTEELKSYIDKGWISTLGNGKMKEIEHKKWGDNREESDYVEQYAIDFISKNFQDTIQNDNLPSGRFYETWFRRPIYDNENHSIVNGYANSWMINTEKLCSMNNSCIKNTDGSYDFELIIEFWPQRLFYIGLAISGTTLIVCMSYLSWAWIKGAKEEERDGGITIKRLTLDK